MTQSPKPADRHAFLLRIACALLLCAIVVYLIGRAESNSQRQEAIMRDQRILRVQNERSIADRAALHEQTARLNESRTQLERQQVALFESVRRLDEMDRQLSLLKSKLETFERSQTKHADQK